MECRMEIDKIYNKDCLIGMKDIPDKSIDAIICDLPYAETGNKWDMLIDVEKLFIEYKRIIKDNGAIVLFGSFRLGVRLFEAAPDLYKYEWIWQKDNGTNAPNVNLQPFRVHEYVFVFGKGRCTNGTRVPMKYNPQKTDGKPYSQKSGRMSDNWKGGLKNIVTNNEDGLRHPKTVQYFKRDNIKLHPTQKPLDFLRYLVRTYTNEGDLVLDNCMGSGTTAVACLKEKRHFIGYEITKEYFDIAQERIKQEQMQLELF